jgi:hypothetical protein
VFGAVMANSIDGATDGAIQTNLLSLSVTGRGASWRASHPTAER